MEVKLRFWDPEKVPPSPEQRCPFNRGNKYKDYVRIFPGPNFLSPEGSRPLNRGVPKERFHCIQNAILTPSRTLLFFNFVPPLFRTLPSEQICRKSVDSCGCRENYYRSWVRAGLFLGVSEQLQRNGTISSPKVPSSVCFFVC